MEKRVCLCVSPELLSQESAEPKREYFDHMSDILLIHLIDTYYVEERGTQDPFSILKGLRNGWAGHAIHSVILVLMAF